MSRALLRPAAAVGDLIWWLHTEGGGGGSGHRANPKTRRAAVVQAVGANAVRVRVLDRPEALSATWVRAANIEPRPVTT